MNDLYDDIIHLPHHVSTRHAPMSMVERAAQFSPFAALSGHADAIREAARPTSARVELDEQAREEIARTLSALLARGGEAAITHFVPDGRKEGGAYVTTKGRVARLDTEGKTLLMADGARIALADIRSLEREGAG